MDLLSEKDCVERLKDLALMRGFQCKKCNGNDFYWKQNRLCFECKNRNCKATIYLKGLTRIRGSKLPLNIWLSSVYLYSITPNITALELQQRINHATYSTSWEILEKIRIWEKSIKLEKQEYQINNQTNLIPNSLLPLAFLAMSKNFASSNLFSIQNYIWNWLLCV